MVYIISWDLASFPQFYIAEIDQLLHVAVIFFNWYNIPLGNYTSIFIYSNFLSVEFGISGFCSCGEATINIHVHAS